jgi:hypothetical protein
VLTSSPMNMTSSLRRVAAWIACLAILMAALAPTLSHALAAARGSSDTWMEICSASSIKFIKVAVSDNPGEPAPAKPAMQMDHCPFCLTHAGALGMPPPIATFAVPLIVHLPTFPALFYQSPRPLFLWAAAQSRAPPAFS